MTSFQRTGRHEWLQIGADPHRLVGEPVPIPSIDAARALLRDLARDAWGMTALRHLAAATRGPALLCWMSDHQILEDLAQRLAARSLSVRALPMPPIEIPEIPEDKPERLPPAEEPVKETTWFELEVLWADGSGPVPNLKFKIKVPEGVESVHTTNAVGVIRFDDIKKGDCEIKSVAAGVKRAEALVVGGGGAAVGAKKKKKKSGTPAYKVVQVQSYKVKTGDTLEALAQTAGMAAKDLAQFNWGTDDPDEISKHLRWDVGCTKKSADGKSYVFDDGDDPGIVLLPQPLAQKASSGTRLTLNLSPAATPSKPWIFSV